MLKKHISSLTITNIKSRGAIWWRIRSGCKIAVQYSTTEVLFVFIQIQRVNELLLHIKIHKQPLCNFSIKITMFVNTKYNDVNSDMYKILSNYAQILINISSFVEEI